MKNKMWLFLLTLVLIIPCTIAFVACGGGDGNGGTGNEYTVTISSGTGYDVSWAGSYDNMTENADSKVYSGVDEGSLVNLTISLAMGYSAENMVVAVNGTTINYSNNTDLEYTFVLDNIQINQDTIISITGIGIAEYDISLPANDTLPEYISSVTISQILKKGTTNPVAYTDQTINYGDSICIAVMTNNNKSLMGNSNGSITPIGLKYEAANNTGYYNHIYPTKTDTVNQFEYYITNISKDYNIINFHNVGGEQELIFTDSSVTIQLDSSYGYIIQPYDLSTHEVFGVEGFEYLAPYGQTFTFIIHDQSGGAIDYTGMQIFKDGIYADLVAQTDTANGVELEYYQISNVTEDMKLSVMGLTFSATYLSYYHKTPFYIDIAGANMNFINLRTSSYFIDSQGRFAFLPDQVVSLNVFSAQGWKVTNRTIGCGANSDLIPATQVFGEETAPYDEQILDMTIREGIGDNAGHWVITYFIYTNREEGPLTLVESTTISTGVSTNETLVLDIDYETERELAQVDLKKAIYAADSNVMTAVEFNTLGFTFSYSDVSSELTLVKDDTILKITNMYKISDNSNGDDSDDTYGVQIGKTFKVYCSKGFNDYEYIEIFISFYRNADEEADGLESVSSLVYRGAEDNWGRLLKENNLYYVYLYADCTDAQTILIR